MHATFCDDASSQVSDTAANLSITMDNVSQCIDEAGEVNANMHDRLFIALHALRGNIDEMLKFVDFTER